MERVNPKVSYYCNLYALEVVPADDSTVEMLEGWLQALGLGTKTEEMRRCMELLLNKLEQQKLHLLLDPDVDKGHCERFALHVYSKAKRRDEQGMADLELAKTYYATFNLIEVQLPMSHHNLTDLILDPEAVWTSVDRESEHTVVRGVPSG